MECSPVTTSYSAAAAAARRRAGSSSAEMQAVGSRILPKTRYRIVVMGAAAVGKSCIVARLLYARFINEYRETIEELHSGQYEVNGLPVTLDILDTSGSHQFPAMRRLSISTGDAFILVYSVDDEVSFQEVERLREEIIEEKVKEARQRGELGEEGEGGEEKLGEREEEEEENEMKKIRPPIVIVGNKTDLQQLQDDKASLNPTTAALGSDDARIEEAESRRGSGCSSSSSSGYARRRTSIMSLTAETKASIDWGHGYVEVSAKDNVNITGIFRELLAQVDLRLVADPNTSVEEQRKAKYFSRLGKQSKLHKRNSCQVS